MNRFQFVADHQRRYGVKRLCTILNIARSIPGCGKSAFAALYPAGWQVCLDEYRLAATDDFSVKSGVSKCSSPAESPVGVIGQPGRVEGPQVATAASNGSG